MWSERWCQSICGTQMCIGWEFKARTIRMIYLLVHCCLHDSNSLAMNSAAVLHRTNADLRYGGGAKGYTFPIWWSRWAWATELGVNWVWAGGLADSMRFSGEKQLRYEHINNIYEYEHSKTVFDSWLLPDCLGHFVRFCSRHFVGCFNRRQVMQTTRPLCIQRSTAGTLSRFLDSMSF